MSYRVIYHVGDAVTLKTRVNSGTLTFDAASIRIAGQNPLTIDFSSVKNVELFRLHGLGRMINLVCTDRSVFLTVIHINLFGYFVIINHFKVGKLCQQLKAYAKEQNVKS